MTDISTIDLIERRVSANLFDTEYLLPDSEIARLIQLATRAPSAYNLQNWRFIAVRTDKAKAKLRVLAYDQPKVSDAAVTFIICGQLPDASTLADRLSASVDGGFMPADMAMAWQNDAARKYADPTSARDEAIRSATLAAATLMFAVAATGLASGPMIGFDADAVAREFDLRDDEIPVMLLTVGRAAPGNWPQKSRRALAQVLTFT